jgi:hypothetical protein
VLGLLLWPGTPDGEAPAWRDAGAAPEPVLVS